jgi:hypothetical protein
MAEEVTDAPDEFDGVFEPAARENAEKRPEPEKLRRIGPGRAGGSRSVRRSLASIVLGFETIIVFLAALLLFGLGSIPAWLALGGGALLCLVMVAVIALLRYRWSYAIGWLVQVIVVMAGFVNPTMFIVGAMFTAMWAYCMVTGSRVDNHKENS